MSNRTSRLQRPRRIRDTNLERVPEGAVLTTAEDGSVVVMNPTAAAIWELCDGDTHIEEMVTAVCALFAISVDRAREDVLRTLGELRDVGAIA
jgi:hypothetical protein